MKFEMAAENWYQNLDLRKIYISKLSPETTEESLGEQFGQYGVVDEIKLIRDKETNAPRGFAFLTMSDQSVVDNILDAAPLTIDGRSVYIRRVIPKDDPNPLAQLKTKKLFIGGLTEEASEEDITNVLAVFTPHPPESIKLMRDRNTNKFKGFAFVNFHSEDVVDKLFLIRKCTIKGKAVELRKAEEQGAGGGDRGGGRGGPRGGGRGFSRGRGASRGGYSQPYDNGNYGAAGGDYGYSSGGGYGYASYQGGDYSSGGGYEGYGGGYSSGGGYGNGGGYGMGQYSSAEPSGYGPSRRGRGRGGAAGGGGGYHPY
ncbi:hypothetical protein OS493_014679 [Desmophyllum pertusum]|uniref:RRM domain-containing protein n=1 Tax=Desmophyllum pertusum TaxID=174260 RepID=A0A9X0CFC3_9CNID|nr:hypothetical protein OS493_014679 [Desmophyllum pertusum]